MTIADNVRESRSRPFRPDPWTIVNIALAGLLILLAAEPATVLLIGGGALCVAAATGAGAALRRLLATPRASLLTLLLTWFPGLVALVLAAAGLALIVRHPDDELIKLGGLALFLMQIAFIAVLDADRDAGRQD